MNSLEALLRIDHTICMNNNENNIKWDIDEFDHCACIDVDDFIKCFDTIYRDLEKYNAYKDLFERIINQKDKSLEYSTSELEYYYKVIEGLKDEKHI